MMVAPTMRGLSGWTAKYLMLDRNDGVSVDGWQAENMLLRTLDCSRGVCCAAMILQYWCRAAQQ